MTDFNQLVPDAKEFLTRLGANNNRDWFTEHKAEYESRLKKPAQLFLDQIAGRLGKRLGTRIKTKLFRIHRDVRFSKDKTPYNTHLHLLWTEATGEHRPGWFFGTSPDYTTAGWGWMAFAPGQLMTWRALLDRDPKIAAFLDATDMHLREPELKRVPVPFDKDHPAADHLRRKSLTVWEEFEPENLEQDLMAQFKKMQPLHDILAGQL